MISVSADTLVHHHNTKLLSSEHPVTAGRLPFQEVHMLATQTSVIQIPVALIKPNPKQPRKRFNPEELANLTNSVREHGIIQPLLVRPTDKDGIHTLVAGERRLRAAKGAELKTVPAVIRDVKADDLAILALVENVIRDDMSPVEEGDAYLELRRKGKSNSQIARMIGTNDVRVAHCINCASLPDKTREMVRAGTGGTSGAGYLEGTLSQHYAFREITEVATFLIERSKRPVLPNALKEKVSFNL